MNRKLLKQNAKDLISGNVLVLALYIILIAVVGMLVMRIPAVGFILWLILFGPLQFSVIRTYLMLKNGSFSVSGIPENIKEGFLSAKDVIPLHIFMNLYICLWSLLFVIPGIIKWIKWSQSWFILASGIEHNWKEAMSLSGDMMDGHKMEYVKLCLSFIPWYLLTAVTFGLAGLYMIPYVQAAMVEFHEYVRLDYENRYIIPQE